MSIYQDLINKKAKLSVIGLGYVGLPVAVEMAKKVPVIGYDINAKRIEMMKKKKDPSKELDSSAFENIDIQFTASIQDVKQASFHIITVPTPIDKNHLPDLSPLISASKAIGSILKKGDYVVYESTVFPGATEEVCVPLLEKGSGLKFVKDFKVGYSPERINPGDKKHTLRTITKVVSGCDNESLKEISKTYALVVDAGIHEVSSIKVAEAAKIIENTQRDVNIALMNELSMIFNKLHINTFEVLEAAGTKWNFLRFYPGLVGGHCIGVDPYYLTFKAAELGHNAQVINSGRTVNDDMSKFIATELVKKIIKAGKNVLNSNILIMGTTFKEDVSDIRNSKVADIVYELKSYGINVDVIDPHADSEDLKHEYGFSLTGAKKTNYDALILAVAHKEYKGLTEDDLLSLTNEKAIFFDVKGIFRNRIKSLTYMSL